MHHSGAKFICLIMVCSFFKQKLDQSEISMVNCKVKSCKLFIRGLIDPSLNRPLPLTERVVFRDIFAYSKVIQEHKALLAVFIGRLS
jgi:hypothetical protein